MSTTITAIRSSLESTIAGLTVGGKPWGRDKYVKAPPGHNWEEPDKKWTDRAFTVGFIEEGEPQYYGTVSDVMYEGSFSITIGHWKSRHNEDGLDRMNTDIMHIKEQLEKESNRPTDVWLIRYTGRSERDLGDYWVSVLNFRTLYTRALA